jgi:hypothetical protein
MLFRYVPFRSIDFMCPYSNRLLEPLTRLIGLTQSLFSGT